MTLDACEFIRRFLMHVLPGGFQRIRYYGFLANRHRAQKLDLCRRLLHAPEPAESIAHQGLDRVALIEILTGVNPALCPRCKQGRLIRREVLPVSPSSYQPSRPKGRSP